MATQLGGLGPLSTNYLLAPLPLIGAGPFLVLVKNIM